MSEKPVFDIEEHRRELVDLRGKLEEKKRCPHCRTQMELGALSATQEKYGCYENKECPYNKTHGWGYTEDLAYITIRIWKEEEVIAAYEAGVQDGKE